MNQIPLLGFSDPISSWSHLLTALSCFFGGFLLLKRGRGNTWRQVAISVYIFSLIFLFSMSGVFHLLPKDSISRGVLQRLDYAGIWLLIAGTFTPIHVILFRGPLRWLVLLFIWTVTLTGLILQVIFFRDFPEWLALSFFLGLGWIGILSYQSFKKNYLKHSPKLIALGGLSYSIGAIFDFIRWPILWYQYFGPHEIFHLFVSLGAFIHWRFIYQWCNHPISDDFLCDIKIYSNKEYKLSGVNDQLELSSFSLEEVKAKALQEIDRRYHHKYKYDVYFRYFHEDKVSSNKAHT